MFVFGPSLPFGLFVGAVGIVRSLFVRWSPAVVAVGVASGCTGQGDRPACAAGLARLAPGGCSGKLSTIVRFR